MSEYTLRVLQRNRLYKVCVCESVCVCVHVEKESRYKELAQAISKIYRLSLEKAMAPHSSTLAWKIPWMEEPVGCSPWGRKELDTTE